MSGGLLGDSGLILRLLGSLLGASWTPFGRSLGRVGASWGPFGALLGPSWAVLEAPWAVLGASWAPLGAFLGHLGAILRPQKRIGRETARRQKSSISFQFLKDLGLLGGPEGSPRALGTVL